METPHQETAKSAQLSLLPSFPCRLALMCTDSEPAVLTSWKFRKLQQSRMQLRNNMPLRWLQIFERDASTSQNCQRNSPYLSPPYSLRYLSIRMASSTKVWRALLPAVADLKVVMCCGWLTSMSVLVLLQIRVALQYVRMPVRATFT